MNLGERIKSLRRERGVTQEYIAERLQVTRQAVSKWENGLAAPSMENLLELSRLFRVPLEQLAGTAALPPRRPEWLWRLLCLTACAAILLAAGCLWQLSRQKVQTAPSSPAAAYERLSEQLLGEALFTLSDGRTAWLRLVLTEGEYFTDAYEDYLPGGGVYPVNYRGSYRLEVCDAAGNRLSSYPLNEDFDSEAMNFPGEVSLALFDYNWDGRPEVSVGQYGSSSTLLYALYTLEGDGKIQKSCPELIADSREITRFSVVFPRGEGEEGKGFRTARWNNATGAMAESFYLWEAAAGQFLPAG